MGVVVEKIKELLLPLNMRIEDRVYCKILQQIQAIGNINHIIIKFVKEDYKSKQHATLNYMNLGQRNVATSTILNG